jgi:hypothetical protein
MRVLPKTHAPIAILQLKPAAIIEDAIQDRQPIQHESMSSEIPRNLPTSQLETAQASAIQYATKEPEPHVRLEGGIGSKSALDAFGVAAKLLGS